MVNSFGTFLSSKRKEKNLTQKELAGLLFVTESAVSKWESDKAHPDITMLPKLAEILGVSEHELITASVDEEKRATVKNARKWTSLVTVWELSFLIAYGITLLTCFIVDLAVSGGLTWFWIVFTALLLAGSFTNLPKYIKVYKVFFISLIEFGCLVLLLATCCIFVGGDWFWVTIIPILFAYIMVFLPIFIAIYKFPNFIKQHNALISAFVDFALLMLLFVVTSSYTNGDWVLSFALPVSAYCFAPVLVSIVAIRYFKINSFFKTSIILLVSGVFAIFINPILQNLLLVVFNKPYNASFHSNFAVWEGDYVGNNVLTLIAITLSLLTILFFVIGILKAKKKKI